MRRALIVGIDDYETSPLNGCVNDAKLMYEVLNTHENGDPNFDCKLYLAPRSNKKASENYDPTKEENSKRITIDAVLLKSKIHKLFSNKSDLSLFYFSGHGLDTPTGGYLMTENAELFNEGVSMNDLLIMANNSLANEVIIILDCCFSGNLGNIGLESSSTLREGVTILTSSSDYQKSMERGGMGAFTRKIVEALEGEAADVIGNVHVGSLYSYTEKMFSSWEQRPLFKGHLNAMRTLRQCKPKIPLKVLRNLPKYFDETLEHQLKPSYEFTHEDAITEHVEVFQDLQKCVSAGLVTPKGVEFMYDAAIESKSCVLTNLGQYYWKLVILSRV